MGEEFGVVDLPPEALIELGIAVAMDRKGDRTANLRNSVALFTAARDRLDLAGSTYLAAWAEYNTAMSHKESGSFDTAIASYRDVVRRLAVPADPLARNLCGLAWAEQAQVHLEQGRVEAAIDHARRALGFQDREFDPRAWGVTHANLATAYGMRTEGDPDENLDRAITAYRAALEVRPLDGDEPALHHSTVERLLAELQRRELRAAPRAEWHIARGERLLAKLRSTYDQAVLDAVVTEYERALTHVTEQAQPWSWASCMNNLGGVLRAWPPRSPHQDRAIEALTASLRVRTRAAAPLLWARTQYNLAATWLSHSTGNTPETAGAAVRAAELALEVLTPELHRDDWLNATLWHGYSLLHRCHIQGADAPYADLVAGLEALVLISRERPDRPAMEALQVNSLAADALLMLAERSESDRATRVEALDMALDHLRAARAVAEPGSDMVRDLEHAFAAVLHRQSLRDAGKATEQFIGHVEPVLARLDPVRDRERWQPLAEQLSSAHLRWIGGDRESNARAAVRVLRDAVDGFGVQTPATHADGDLHYHLATALVAAREHEEAATHYLRAIGAYADAGSDQRDRALATAQAQLFSLRTKGTRRRWLWHSGPAAGAQP